MWAAALLPPSVPLAASCPGGAVPAGDDVGEADAASVGEAVGVGSEVLGGVPASVGAGVGDGVLSTPSLHVAWALALCPQWEALRPGWRMALPPVIAMPTARPTLPAAATIRKESMATR